MKKWLVGVAFVFAVGLCGCSGETFEVIGDVSMNAPDIEPKKVHFEAPQDEDITVMNTDNGILYLSGNYEVSLQTYPSGNLDQTLRTVTGYSREQLAITELSEKNADRYVCAWSAVSEEGELVGRCTIQDDGRFHYCLTVLVKADMAGELRDTVDAVFADYSLVAY